jgi:hypothetical protein
MMKASTFNFSHKVTQKSGPQITQIFLFFLRVFRVFRGSFSYEQFQMMPRPHPETNKNQYHRIAQHIGSPRRGALAAGGKMKRKKHE